MYCENNIPCSRTDNCFDNDSFMSRICIGYAYVIPQKLTQVYDPHKALFCGTLFPQLDMPLGVYEKMGKCNHE